MAEKERKHTPTPWIAAIGWNKKAGCYGIIRPVAGNLAIAQLTDYFDTYPAREQEANAALIVRAVNAHEELTAALTRAMYGLNSYREVYEGRDASERNESACKVIEACRQALARAKGE